ncbi:MAG: DUF1732 domain-containing protein [Desulfobacterales bacterium]
MRGSNLFETRIAAIESKKPAAFVSGKTAKPDHCPDPGIVDIDPARIAQGNRLYRRQKRYFRKKSSAPKSHLQQFRSLMDGPDPCGRPLNFLLQEFNREFNTMGSKAADAEIAHVIVSAKTELEKIREQIQNLE